MSLIRKPTPRIPKLMTFFWAGDKLSWMRYMTVYSFRKLNPDWKIRIISSTNIFKDKPWDCHNVQDFMWYKGENYFPLLDSLDVEIIKWELDDPFKSNGSKKTDLSPPHKCDFLEWKTLTCDGGFFSDFDILYVKPIDNLYNTLSELRIDTGLCYSTLPNMQFKFFSIGFMCSASGNQFYSDLYQWTFKSYDPKQYQSTGVFSMYSMLTNGLVKTNNPLFSSYLSSVDLLNTIHKKYPSLKVYNFDFNVVYPWNWLQLNDIFIKDNSDYIAEETIGIHWYGGAELSQSFNHVTNHTNYKNMKNTFCESVIKYVDP